MKLNILEPRFKNKIFLLSKLLGITSIILLIFFVYTNSKVEDDFSEYEGFFIRTDKEFFFVVYKNSTLFTKNEVVKIVPVNNNIIFDDFNSGDQIIIRILTVGDLNPRVADVYEITLVRKGDISNIENSIINYLESFGYKLDWLGGFKWVNLILNQDLY